MSFAVLHFELWAQHCDVGIWAGLSAGTELVEDVDLKGELQSRFDRGMTRYSSLLGDLGLRYKISKPMNVSLNYRMGQRQENDGYLSLRHRLSLDLTYEWDFGKPELDLRVRYQAGLENGAGEGGIADLREGFRFRLRGSTELMDDLDGDLSAELFRSRDMTGFYWSDWRLRFELTRKINKHQDLTIGYLFQQETLVADPLMEHIISVGYSFDL